MDTTERFDEIDAAFWAWRHSDREDVELAFATLMSVSIRFVQFAFSHSDLCKRDEDVLVSEVFCRIAECGHTVEETSSSSPSAWIRCISKNVFLDYVKSSWVKHSEPLTEEIAATLVTDEELLTRQDLAHIKGELLTAALRNLDERDRTLIELRTMQGRPYEEIESVMGIRPKHGPIYHSRALLKLAQVPKLKNLHKEIFE